MEDSVEICPEILQGVPELLKEKLIDMMQRLDSVEEIVKLVESNQLLNEFDKLTPLEQVKLNWISLYALNSLFFVYLKNTGTNLKEHPILSELSRIRSYMSRINEISSSEDYKNKTNKVDKESTARIIKRSLWMNANTKSKKVSDIVNSTLESGIEKRMQVDGVENTNKKVKLDEN